MEVFRVAGGRPLAGEVTISGAKNGALPILAAALGCVGTCRIRNCPALTDVELALEILESLGAACGREGDSVIVAAQQATGGAIPPALMGAMRGSLFFLGPCLGRFGHAELRQPGGCRLGDRPVDLHLAGFRALGAEIYHEEDRIVISGKLHGGQVVLRYPSVGATVNVLLAACWAQGTTTIVGGAREPEIVDLANFINRCGGCVRGAGTGTIQVEGCSLHGCEYTLLPDRIEAATYLTAVACASGEGVLRQCQPRDMQEILQFFRRAGCQIQTGCDIIQIQAVRLRSPGLLRTGPHPGFPTDAQALAMAALLKADGTTLVEETVFSHHFAHIPALRALGGRIQEEGSIALIRGVERLQGSAMEATDLRGGAAMLAAALGAEGTSAIRDPGHILRGYENPAEKLRGLGAEILLQGEEIPWTNHGKRKPTDVK